MIVYVFMDPIEVRATDRPTFRHTLDACKDLVRAEAGPFRAGFEVRQYHVLISVEQLMDALNGAVTRSYVEEHWGKPANRWRGTAGGGLRRLEDGEPS